MLKVSKKLIASIFVIIVVFNFIGSTYLNYSYAAAEDVDLEDVVTVITNVMGGIVSIAMWPLRLKVTMVAIVINVIEATVATMDNTGGTTKFFITPYDIFFNKIPLLDIDIFDTSGTGVLSEIRGKVAEWYYAMRLVSVAALVAVLGYIGIQMAISTMADDKAKYKRMLVDWVASVAILFLLHYIMIFIIMVNSALVNAIDSFVTSSTMAGYDDQTIQDAFSRMAMKALVGIGMDSLTATIVFSLLVFQTAGFIVSYLNRMIKACFLVIIAPLITITYSIDKIKDQKSQALDGWLKEYAYTILIQPFHCIIYATFISITYKLIGDPSELLPFDDIKKIVSPDYNQLVAGLFAIFACTFIYTAEKLVRKIFNISDDASKTSMAAGAAISVAAVANAKKLGAKTKAGLNMASEATKKFGEHAKALGQKVDNLSQKDNALGSAIRGAKGAAGKVSNSKLGQGVKKASGAVKKGVGRVKASDKYKKFASGMDKLTAGVNNVLKAPKSLNDKLAGIASNEKNSKTKRFFANIGSRALAKARSSGRTGNVAKWLTTSAMLAAGKGPLEAYGAASGIGEGVDSLMSYTTGELSKGAADLKGAFEGLPDNETVSKLKSTLSSLESLKETADKTSAEAANLQNNADDIQNQMDKVERQMNTAGNPTQRADLQNQYSSLSKKRDGYLEELDKKKKDLQAAQQNLANALGKDKYNEDDYNKKHKELEENIVQEQASQYADYFDQIQSEGKAGRFANGVSQIEKSRERRVLELSVKNELKELDADDQSRDVINQIYSMASAGMSTTDITTAIESQIQSIVSARSGKVDFSRLISAVQELGKFEEQANLYNSISSANSVNLSNYRLAEAVARRQMES